MVADVAFISNSPVVLIDEIENAGIKKHEAMKLLSGSGKIVLVVTHDPLLALLTQRRIVMQNGGIQKIIRTSVEETNLCAKLYHVDKELFKVREMVRAGEEITTGFDFGNTKSMQLNLISELC